MKSSAQIADNHSHLLLKNKNSTNQEVFHNLKDVLNAEMQENKAEIITHQDINKKFII